MFLEKIKSKGLAHLSYILGDGGKAAVIVPRRDCGIYREIADREGCRITEIFETHRNEDYVIGSVELARLTGAAIRHGSALPFAYGEAVTEGDEFPLGDLTLKVLKTPGHTDESISIVLYERGAVLMSLSTVIVAVNARLLKVEKSAGALHRQSRDRVQRAV